VVYIYFDYNAQKIQTSVNILTNLIRQLSQSDISPELEALYDQSMRDHIRPDENTFRQLLTSCSQKFSSVYAVFDALDECSESYQKEMLALFTHLQNSAYRLLISFRPHLYELRDKLESTQTLDVSAKDSDLRGYITTRLERKGNRSAHLKDRCTELAKNVDGM